MLKYIIPLVALSAFTTPLHAQVDSDKQSIEFQAKVNPDAIWPVIKEMAITGGTFVSRDNVRLLHLGMSKQQIYPLLDVPQYTEGFLVRHWNYVLNFRADDKPGTIQCQLQIHFDRHFKVDGFLWKDKICMDMIARHHNN